MIFSRNSGKISLSGQGSLADSRPVFEPARSA